MKFPVLNFFSSDICITLRIGLKYLQSCFNLYFLKAWFKKKILKANPWKFNFIHLNWPDYQLNKTNIFMARVSFHQVNTKQDHKRTIKNVIPIIYETQFSCPKLFQMTQSNLGTFYESSILENFHKAYPHLDLLNLGFRTRVKRTNKFCTVCVCIRGFQINDCVFRSGLNFVNLK